MIEDEKLARLRACAIENGCSEADLRRVIFYLPWHLPTVMRKARLRLVAFMRRAAASWFAFSISSGRGPDTTIRNIIAAARAEDLPTYHLILQWIRSNFHPLREDFDGIGKMLPSGTPIQRIVRSVLYDNVRPAEIDIREFFRGEPRRMVKIVLDGYRENLVTLDELLAAAVELCGAENASHASAAAGVLMDVRRKRGIQPSLKKRNLAALPKIWRRMILFSAVRRSAFLAPEFRFWLESNPFRSPDMPQAIRYQRARERALDAISSGHFGNQAIQTLLENRIQFLKVSKRVARALLKSPQIAKSLPSEHRYSKPEQYLHDAVALALLIRSTHGAVLSCPEAWRRRGWIPRALQMLPDSVVDSTLQHLNPDIQKKIIKALGSHSQASVPATGTGGHQ